jgi:hypothetical protein
MAGNENIHEGNRVKQASLPNTVLLTIDAGASFFTRSIRSMSPNTDGFWERLFVPN